MSFKSIWKWFTLIEIVVAATILVIISSIGFYSYVQNISDARDGVRKTDLAILHSQLKLYKKQRGAYPRPWDSFQLTNHWADIVQQGKMNQQVSLSTAENLPSDPELNIPYLYSTTINRQEFEIAATIENTENPYAFVEWDYKSVAKTVLPSLILAVEKNIWTKVEIASGSVDGNQYRTSFILHNWIHNLPYNINSWTPFTDGSDFNVLLDDVAGSYWQNTDYTSCEEIQNNEKSITKDGHSDIYQIRNSSGVLENITCTFPL